MIDALLISITAVAAGFAAAWAFNLRTREQLAAIKARAEEQARAADDKLELVANARQSLGDAFKALSADALSASSTTFLKLATATLEKFEARAKGDLSEREQAVQQLVQPLRESLVKVDNQLGAMEKSREHAYAALNEQLRGLVETHLPALHTETQSLVKALRQPTVRGRWGEMQLERAVEMAGMLEHCDFVRQPSAATEDGRQRPDLVVKLPGGRQIVIDAKAPYAAYLDAHEAASDDERAAHLARHAKLVREHMTALGRKAYWERFSPTPEIVIMFLPGEMLFSAALQSDPTLIELGVNEKVVPATPTTLIALLRTVAYGWTQAALADNAQQVADLARELYERIGNLAEHWTDVGQKLGKAVDSYNKSVGTLERRVLATARKFEPLKAAPEGAELVSPDLVEQVPRLLQAPELVAPADAAAANEAVDADEAPTDAAAAHQAAHAAVDARVARIG